MDRCSHPNGCKNCVNNENAKTLVQNVVDPKSGSSTTTVTNGAGPNLLVIWAAIAVCSSGVSAAALAEGTTGHSCTGSENVTGNSSEE
jgi:hypothetical protein